MRGVSFGSYHTAEDWDLILNEKSLTPPEPKTTYISIEGRDGDLDISEALSGEIKYNNRTASFKFLLTEGSYSDREAAISEILRIVHGKRLKITLDDNPEYYLSGRCTVTERINDRAYGVIAIECNCDPWFYNQTETSRSITATSTVQTVVLANNGGKTVTPEVTVTGSVTIGFGSSSVTLSAGTYKLTDLLLKTGNTSVTVKGSGTVVFKYREGVL